MTCPQVVEILIPESPNTVSIVPGISNTVVDVLVPNRPAVIETVVRGPQGAAGPKGDVYIFQQLSPESVPYRYSLFLFGEKWHIRRWNPATLTIMTASGDTGSSTAWTNRVNLTYS